MLELDRRTLLRAGSAAVAIGAATEMLSVANSTLRKGELP